MKGQIEAAAIIIEGALATIRAEIANARSPAPSLPSVEKWLRWPSAHKPHFLVSPFGADRKTFTHEGLDIRAPDGTEVYACADGVVDLIYTGKFYGICVRILHDRKVADYQTYYAHLKQTPVIVGQLVGQGQLIGLADNTGNSSGAHLHLTLVKIGNRTKLRGISLVGCIDPMLYMIDPPAILP